MTLDMSPLPEPQFLHFHSSCPSSWQLWKVLDLCHCQPPGYFPSPELPGESVYSIGSLSVFAVLLDESFHPSTPETKLPLSFHLPELFFQLRKWKFHQVHHSGQNPKRKPRVLPLTSNPLANAFSLAFKTPSTSDLISSLPVPP